MTFLLQCFSTPAHSQDRFIQVEEGLLDNDTGVVWGHHLYLVDEYLTKTKLGYRVSSSRSWDFTMQMWVWDGVDTDGDGIPDDADALTTTYTDFSNSFYNRNDQDWRVPTRDELAEAISAGLLLYLDVSPDAGFQSFDSTAYHSDVWSSTKGKKKPGGFDSAFKVNLLDGSASNITVGSFLYGTIPVRGASSTSGGDGGGKGKGGGKNK